MKGLMRGVVVTGVLAGLLAVGATSAHAKPKYKTVFEKTYEKVVKDNGKDGKLNCLVCHAEGDDKKKRNNYGEALAKIIKKGETDDAKVKEALEKTEKEKSAVADKTFGDLLKDGKLPASK